MIAPEKLGSWTFQKVNGTEVEVRG
jgi:hypothetical protein